jgi:hypothetical protein
MAWHPMTTDDAHGANRAAVAFTRGESGAVVGIADLYVTVRVRDDGRLLVMIDVPDSPLLTDEGRVPLVVSVGEMTLYATDEYGRNPWHQVPEWGAP